MAQQDAAPKGPDLTTGVPAADIPDGGHLVGHVGDDEVLVARVEGRLLAVGARCTHYQGPLGEGLIVDGVVRCPWHHARFCLRTGEAVGAPAIDPLRRWSVREEGGTVRVGADEPQPAEADATARRPAVDRPRRVLIVGGGAAGFAAAELLRREGFDGAVTMLSADADAPYDRPNCSKDYLAGEAPAEWMPLRGDDWYADNDIDLQLNAEAIGLDVAARNVTLKDGRSFGWDALLLATGAEPVRLSAPGFDRPDAHVLRSLRDADAIGKAAQGAKRAVVVGASFIGLEAAAALRQRGLDVHVAAPEAVPLARVMGDELGRWLQGLHEASGVVFHLGRGVAGWDGRRLMLEGGEVIAADLLLVGAGVKPRVALAQAGGLAVDNGVLVDERLRAAPGVYAAGDIARYPDPACGRRIRVEHWVHAERQGQHVARLILGDDAPYADTPFFWSAHPDVSIRYVGHAERFDPPVIDGALDRQDAEARFMEGGRLAALATVGRDLRALQAGLAFERAGMAL